LLLYYSMLLQHYYPVALLQESSIFDMTDAFGAGFSPRVHPRPEYEPFLDILLHTLKSMCWQSGVFGCVIATLTYPHFQDFCAVMRSLLGEEYGTDAVVFSIFMSLVHTVTYVIVNGSFAMFDMYGYFQKYKLARKPYMTPKRSLVLKALGEAAFGQLIINPVATFFLFQVMKKYGMADLSDPLPEVKDMFTTFCLAHLINGVGFYCAHRLFHAKAIYASFHKQVGNIHVILMLY
jgi:hypothetical protein